MAKENLHHQGETGGKTEGKRTPQSGVPESRRSLVWWSCAFLPFGYLWFRLINNLRLEWDSNPQYSYGFVVPILSLGLLMRRWTDLPAAGEISRAGQRRAAVLFCAFAILYLPSHLIEAATPYWRPLQWSLAIETIGLTLAAVYLWHGRGWVGQLAFPVCFFLIAVPWPTPIEEVIIQSLTRVNSAVVVDLLGWGGIPAVQHGNLIEVGTGTVGVSEACSGIRSFQTSLMISLFFGEYYLMKLPRRLLLIPIGVVFAMVFNICRMTFLTVVAARKGVPAIEQYHDPAGMMITVFCTLGLWAAAYLVNRKTTVVAAQADSGGRAEGGSEGGFGRLIRFSGGLVVWIVIVDVGCEFWFRRLESHLESSINWVVQLPSENSTLKALAIPPETKALLLYDSAVRGEWSDADGLVWNCFYCDWKPGRVAGYLAKRHTPEICLTAVGLTMIFGPELDMLKVNGADLPVRSYIFGREGHQEFVFHCRWEAGAKPEAYVTHESGRFNLIRAVWAGRGNHGQKIIEMVVSGCRDMNQAKAALLPQLQRIIRTETSAAQN
jgi:exosortase